MCNFFSLVSNGDSKPLYFNWKQRQAILKGKIKCQSADSHTSIADYYGFKGVLEDKLNKYEYNPITKVFQIDQKNNPIDDSDDIEKFCKEVDFKTIVEPLNIHSLVNPFKDRSIVDATPQDILLLKKWASVWASVWAYIGTCVDIKYKVNIKPSNELKITLLVGIS